MRETFHIREFFGASTYIVGRTYDLTSPTTDLPGRYTVVSVQRWGGVLIVIADLVPPRR